MTNAFSIIASELERARSLGERPRSFVRLKKLKEKCSEWPKTSKKPNKTDFFSSPKMSIPPKYLAYWMFHEVRKIEEWWICIVACLFHIRIFIALTHTLAVIAIFQTSLVHSSFTTAVSFVDLSCPRPYLATGRSLRHTYRYRAGQEWWPSATKAYFVF